MSIVQIVMISLIVSCMIFVSYDLGCLWGLKREKKVIEILGETINEWKKSTDYFIKVINDLTK